MDTKKIKKGNTLFVAHRGVCGLEAENTAASFVAAGNRSFFAIETDVHVTKDGQYILIHDNETGRVSKENYIVEETAYETLRNIQLLDPISCVHRKDLRMPSLDEYLSICQKYEKYSVLEFKSAIQEEHILKIVDRVKAFHRMEKTIFISFHLENLVTLRKAYPKQPAQYLVGKVDDWDRLYQTLKKYRFGLDAEHTQLTKERIDAVHAMHLPVNAWTVDDLDRAQELIDLGIDYITTDIIEGI